MSFDVLSGIEYDLYYVIEHCDFDWKKSQLLKSEYLQGFDDVKIEDYYSSFNTYQIYTHYKINFCDFNARPQTVLTTVVNMIQTSSKAVK